MTEGQFQEVINEACRKFDLSETSGHRTVKRNASIKPKGAIDSQHLSYKCRDLVPDDLTRMGEIKSYFESKGFYVEPLVQAKDHIHVDDRYNATWI